MSLANLISLQVAILNGEEVYVPDRDYLGPFGGLHFHNGAWIGSGTAAVRAHLRQALGDWASQSRPDAKIGLGRLWGLTGPPLNASEVAAMIESTTRTKTGESVVRKWAATALNSMEHHPAIGKLAVAGPAEASPLPRPIPPLDPANWPAPADWFELRSLAPDHLSTLDNTWFRSLVRESVEHELRSTYFDWADARELAMYLGRFVFPTWNNKLSLPVPSTSRPDDKEWPLKWRVSPVLQMLAFDALDSDRLETLWHSARSVEKFLALAPTHPSGGLHLLNEFPPEMGAALQHALTFAIPEADRQEKEEIERPYLNLSAMDGLTALGFADLIVDSADSRKPRLISKYVELRKRAAASRARGHVLLDAYRAVNDDAIPEGVQIALADQAVHLVATRAKDHENMEILSTLIATARTAKYVLLAPRNVALSIEDPVRMPDRLGRLARIEMSTRSVPEKLERAETSQQVALAIADTCVRIVEHGLRHGVRIGSQPYFDTITLRSVEWSGFALERLTPVVDFRGGELPSGVRANASISRETWLQTAREVRHRTLLTVYTALQSGLATPAVVGRVELADVNSAFRSLISTPGLDRGLSKNIGMQGTWLSFLNGGSVPQSDAPTHRLFTGELEFLYRSFPESDAAHPMVTCDVTGSAAWHYEVARDRGTLGTFSRGRVWEFLDEASEGRYSAWRSMLAERR